MTDLLFFFRRALAALAIAAAGASAWAQTGDYIIAVVNQELVTNSELQQRLALIRAEAARNRTALPPDAALRQRVLDTLIDERVLVTSARDSGTKIDEPELDRAVAAVAAQNQITVAQLRERLRREGLTYNRFRDGIRDQMLVERVREREVVNRIRVTDGDIDAWIAAQRAKGGADAELNIAQVLVSVPEGASEAVVAERRERAAGALRRVRAGEDFATVARELSEDSNRATGGEIGMRPVGRLPDVFVRTVQPLKAGEVAPELLQTGAGFHVLKLVERKEASAFNVPQTRVRHILLRPSAELSGEVAARRLMQFKREIQAGTRTFEALARDNSQDGSAAQGGDLGWASPGTFVPEFDAAVSALAIGAISDPVATRFGVHLIQVVDRRLVTLDARQQREQARNVLREEKFEAAYTEWLRDLRGRAYIELREPPQ